MSERYKRMIAVVPTEDGGIEVRLDGVNGEPIGSARDMIDFIRRGIISIERVRAVPDDVEI